MSRELYTKWWVLTKDQLAKLQKFDQHMKDDTKPTKDRVLASKLVGGTYARYCMLVQDLDACLDQYAQVSMKYHLDSFHFDRLFLRSKKAEQ